MPFNLFGFSIKRKNDNRNLRSIAAKPNLDGAIQIERGHARAFFDLDGSQIQDDYFLITKYREMSLNHDCNMAIEHITNEALVTDERQAPVQLVLDDLEYPEKIKDVIRERFDDILRLLNFQEDCYELFRRWYIDGRLYFQKIIDENNPKDGIQELRYIDPRQIRLVRLIETKMVNGFYAQEDVDEYFVYSPYGITGTDGQYTDINGGMDYVKIRTDSICYVHSGLTDVFNQRVLSPLHIAIKPTNLLSMLEDALVIYRVARAPERLIFYVDVAGMNKAKSEEYMKSIMNQVQNKVIFDANTGQIRDDRNFHTMLENYWIPRQTGSQGTQIQQLPGGQNLSQMDDVEYFRDKLYRSLRVPSNRLKADDRVLFGRVSEMTREELVFTKMINRLRNQFNHLFLDLLGTELILTRVMTPEEWDEAKQEIYFDYISDSQFSELRDAEIMRERSSLFREIEPMIGTYVSKKYVREKVFRMTEDEINKMQEEIEEEKKQEQKNPDSDQQEPQFDVSTRTVSEHLRRLQNQL